MIEQKQKRLRNVYLFLVIKGIGLCYSSKFATLYGFSKWRDILTVLSQPLFKEDYSNELELLKLKQKEGYDLFLTSYKEKLELLKSTGHYKGRRIIFCLPLRGQRTHTNARTCKRVKTGIRRIGIKKRLQKKI